VHLDADYDSGKSRATLTDRGLSGKIVHKGEEALRRQYLCWSRRLRIARPR
jgi:hypothetical protein